MLRTGRLVMIPGGRRVSQVAFGQEMSAALDDLHRSRHHEHDDEERAGLVEMATHCSTSIAASDEREAALGISESARLRYPRAWEPSLEKAPGSRPRYSRKPDSFMASSTAPASSLTNLSARPGLVVLLSPAHSSSSLATE